MVSGAVIYMPRVHEDWFRHSKVDRWAHRQRDSIVIAYGKGTIIIIIGGVGLSPLGTAATSGLLYKPQMIDEDDCGAIGGMKFGRGNRSTRIW
jgi:hypothetical protein